MAKEYTKDALAALVAGEYTDATLVAAARMLAALMAAQAAAEELERLMSDGTYAKDAALMGIDFNVVVAQLAAAGEASDDERCVEKQNVWDKVSERFGWDKMYNATLNDDEPGWLMQNLAEGIETRQAALAELTADTRIVAVVCNNDKEVGTSYTVVLERDGVLVKVPRWSCVYAIGGTRRLTAMFEAQLAEKGAMNASELQDMLDEAEDMYDE